MLCNFARPIAMAQVDKETIVVLCKEQPDVLYRVTLDRVTERPYVRTCKIGQDLVSITSGNNGNFFALGSCRSSIYIYDDSLSVITTHGLSKMDRVMHMSYERESKELYVALRSEENKVRCDIYSVTSEYKLLYKEGYLLDQSEVSGIIRMRSWIVISDRKKDELVAFDPDSGVRRLLAKHGRNGRGYVRRPGSIRRYKDGFLVVDQANYVVQTYDADCKFVEQCGGKGNGIYGFDLPSDLLLIGESFVIADMNNDRLVRYSLQKPEEPTVIVSREFCPGKLSRPTSFLKHEGEIYICDRGNDAIQVLDLDLRPLWHLKDKWDFALSKPSAIQLMRVEKQILLAVLSRPDLGNATLSLIDPYARKLIRSKEMCMLSSPQGMIRIDEDRLCVMDSLNRRARLFDCSFRQIAELDLADIASEERFLCRVPSVVDGEVWFSDYHSDKFVAIDKSFDNSRSFVVPAKRFKMKHIRKVIKEGDAYFVIGRGERDLAVAYDELSSGRVIFPDCKLSNSAVDMIFHNGDTYILQKEVDAIVKSSLIELQQTWLKTSI